MGGIAHRTPVQGPSGPKRLALALRSTDPEPGRRAAGTDKDGRSHRFIQIHVESRWKVVTSQSVSAPLRAADLARQRALALQDRRGGIGGFDIAPRAAHRGGLGRRLRADAALDSAATAAAAVNQSTMATR